MILFCRLLFPAVTSANAPDLDQLPGVQVQSAECDASFIVCSALQFTVVIVIVITILAARPPDRHQPSPPGPRAETREEADATKVPSSATTDDDFTTIGHQHIEVPRAGVLNINIFNPTHVSVSQMAQGKQTTAGDDE